ncbi:hypothetical protein H811_YJM1400M00330 [Saccharomyces cerevisiae YJM1400]|nr:hypothetical protein H811_YJM1400M00330 [Saccharomyces cerevisiae YJM1400]AJS98249.1 hypothetical protein H829_YJM1479M00330 [Saccharomyces cerevisiae YJM1479]
MRKPTAFHACNIIPLPLVKCASTTIMLN